MQPQQPGLVRVLGPWVATAIVVGTVIGSGVFKKGRNVADAVPEFGPAMAVWVLGGVLALLGALTLAEIAVLFPRAGGNYVFLREAYGRMWGFLWGWVEFWIIRSASIAALGTMFTESFHDVLKQSLYPDQQTHTIEVLGFWPRQAMTAAVIAVLAAVNARGTKFGGGLQLAIAVLKVGSLLMVVLLPFVVMAVVSNPQYPPRVENIHPLWPASSPGIAYLSAFGGALVGVLWAYHGWMNIAPIAEEVKNPGRNLPLAVIAGVLLLILLYCGANAAFYLVVPHAEIVAKNTANELSSTPLVTQFFTVTLGGIGGMLGSVVLMVSVFGALNGNLLVGPRLLYAMGKDGLAPRQLQELHPRFGTPMLATAALAGWSCLMVFAVGVLVRNELPTVDLFGHTLDLNLPKGKSPFDVVTDFVIFGSASFETLAVASIFVFRRQIPPTRENRPYRCLGYPVVPALYILIMLAVLTNMFFTQRTEAVIGVGFIFAGAVVYLSFLRRSQPI